MTSLSVTSALFPAGEYAIQHVTKACTTDNMLGTIGKCYSAKAVLDPSAGPVKEEEVETAPRGCSRYKDKWYFNKHRGGVLDGISSPVCKANAGHTSE